MADKEACASASASVPTSKRRKRKARSSSDVMQLILQPDSLLGNLNPTRADQPSNSNNPTAADDNAETGIENQEAEHSLQETVEEKSEAEVKIPIKKRDKKRFVIPEDEVKDFMVSCGPMTQITSGALSHINADSGGGGGGDGYPMTISRTLTDTHNADGARTAKEVVFMSPSPTTQSQDKGTAVIKSTAVNGGDGSNNKNKPSKQPRRLCVECDSDQSWKKNPRWRSGPEGSGTLCQSCGIKYAREQQKKANR